MLPLFTLIFHLCLIPAILCVLYCIVLYCIVLYCIVMYFVAFFNIGERFWHISELQWQHRLDTGALSVCVRACVCVCVCVHARVCMTDLLVLLCGGVVVWCGGVMVWCVMWWVVV